MAEFDNDAHEAMLAERYRKMALLETFDTLVDMALDGVITMDQAIEEYKLELAQDE
jgi:hypothetical protein